MLLLNYNFITNGVFFMLKYENTSSIAVGWWLYLECVYTCVCTGVYMKSFIPKWGEQNVQK